MLSSHLRFSLFSILALFLILCPLAVQAQQSTSKPKSVTGCLQKGVEEGGFFILGEKEMWELSGNIDAKHVGHTVTVTGHVIRKAKVKEAKFTESEKQEANGKPYRDFEVTGLKMVSDACK